MTAAMRKIQPQEQRCERVRGVKSNNSAAGAVNNDINQNKNVTLLAFTANEG